MIAVVVLSGPFRSMHGLDADRSPSLLPLGDRPALQHIVESLVTQRITSIELIVGYAPERVEELLGTGDRWGCTFRYHLATDPKRPYRSLNVIAGLNASPWLLVHAERFPCVEFPHSTTRSILYCDSLRSENEAAEPSFSSSPTWGGTAVVSPAEDVASLAGYSYDELCHYFEHRDEHVAVERTVTDHWIDVSTPARLLESQRRLLDKTLQGLLISGAERESGVWIARNATIHPSVRITAPIYIGTNSRLSKGVKVGPHVVVGPDCIIDSNTVLEDALVFGGSYVGEALEVHKSIVAHNLLVNVRLDASVDISENFLLGRLDRPRPAGAAGRALQQIVAALLLIVFLPATLLAWLYFVVVRSIGLVTIRPVCLPAETRPLQWQTFYLPCLGEGAWAAPRPAGWSALCRQFLPGLFAAVGGHIALVGLPPRTPEQISALAKDWRAMVLDGRAGLITEASVAVTDPEDEMQLYLADAYFTVQQGAAHNARLALKYFARLILPRRK
jgi:NDP-sugar pyrophosphorylase family protein